MATASGAGGGGGGFDEGDWNFWPNKSKSMSERAQLASVPQAEQAGGGGGGGEGDGDGWPDMPISMSERARMALVPMPETALNCPRCDSNNTKFCYFNNYSLTQPRHFCHACRCYWTRGGVLRRAKRRTKPKAAMGAAGGMTSASFTVPSSAATGTSGAAAVPAGIPQYSAPCSAPTARLPAGSLSLFKVSSEVSLE